VNQLDDAITELLRALEFAAIKHRDQRRKGAEATPYINHPIQVARILADGGISDVGTLQAAILHDTIEDTRTTAEELEHTFGRTVRLLVEEVTDDKNLRKDERKSRQIESAGSLSTRAKEIKIADKIANVHDVANAPPRDWTLDRRREYLDWAERVVQGCRGVNRLLDARWDDAHKRAIRKLEDRQENDT
jgi:guanosine-3',5'-bis(diphosphate) 3'-pyrophosphohydrolase